MTDEPKTANQLRQTVICLYGLQREIEQKQDTFASIANGVEKIANALLENESGFIRAGQCCELVEIEYEQGDTEYPILHFKVSNGYDREDDFHVRFRLQQLEQDVIEHREQQRLIRRRNKLNYLKGQRDGLDRQIHEIETGIEEA